ncbi:hypothetical protein [Aminobacter sp. Piv2-1]|uniref:hypothetical protein n=1 Tax=Aminobacter sp. Piv2-1 TaxID=3031122 RepID=UPI0030AB7EC4
MADADGGQLRQAEGMPTMLKFYLISIGFLHATRAWVAPQNADLQPQSVEKYSSENCRSRQVHSDRQDQDQQSAENHVNDASFAAAK